MTAVKWPGEWLRGVLQLCVLSALEAGPTYGYAIGQRLEEAGLGTVKGGTLYPLLGRLESDGLVRSTWAAGEGGPGRKYFQLSDAGRRELHDRVLMWRQFTAATALLLPAAGTTEEES
ncbi:MAG: PadR family transcriptional regulator [Dactylosporangium sp.]|nr:PadR family transcriptional regulator [Dactylosporangium sp.]NNJ62599.1 PadR family transcriptional regulator [Dactylosporangium sp.]